MPPKKEKEKLPKEKKKDPKKQASELTQQNEHLTEEVAAMKIEVEATRLRLLTLYQKLLESKDQKWKMEHRIQNDTDLLVLGENIFLDVISDLMIKKKEYEESVEVQVERLEKRITQMSLELARYATKCQAYEAGLKGFLTCDNLNSIKDRVYHLLVVAGEAYHSCEANDPERDPAKLFMIEGITDQPGSATNRVIDFANKLNLIPPATKYPGDTLIRDMIPELLLLITKELSLEKSSGADWRMLACHVGIEQATVDSWQAAKLSNPAGRVFTEWLTACPAATVRFLHRHLMSPPMRCTILCKRITDFYNVG